MRKRSMLLWLVQMRSLTLGPWGPGGPRMSGVVTTVVVVVGSGGTINPVRHDL